MRRFSAPSRLLFALVSLFLALPAIAQADAAGSRDHPMFSRIPGFYIADYEASEFDSHAFSVAKDDDRIEQAVEGRKTVIHYALKEGGKALSSLQIVRNYATAARSIGGRQVYENTDPANRSITIVVPKPEGEVWLEAAAAGGDDYVLTVVQKAALVQDVTANALFDALQRDGRVALYINFDTGKATIRPDSTRIVDEVAAMLAAQPGLKLAVEGHTDNVGTAAANKALSQQRAQAVVAALAAKGVAAGRLDAAGYGPERPVADNATEAGRARNRRVELVKR